MSDSRSPVVSFDDDPLILVDDDDRVVGHESKAVCHDGAGLLHRALSVFLFDRDGQVLLQQRSGQKRLWPLYWSNACCSHPRRNEEVADAAHRRTMEELGVESALQFVFKFQYHAAFKDLGAEHELCAVFVGRHDGKMLTNDNEIAATKKISCAELDQELADNPEKYSPWLKIEWQRLRDEFWPTVEGWVARS